MRQLLPLLGILILTLTASKCKKDPIDPNVVNPNPCESFVKNKPTIELTAMLGNIPVNVEGDTIFFDQKSEFNNWYSFVAKADGEFQSVKWKIGTDTREWQGAAVNFQMTEPDAEIDVIAYVTRKPNPTCKVNDTGIDTIKKTFYTKYGKPNDMKWEGRYLGYLESNKSDTFTVTIKYFTKYPSGPYSFGTYSNFFLDNMPKGYHATEFVGTYMTGHGLPIRTVGKHYTMIKAFGTDWPGTTYPHYSLGTLNSDTLKIYYTNKWNEGFREDRFIGVRRK
jgi:hypothetical protein